MTVSEVTEAPKFPMLLKESEVAEILRVSLVSVRRWRKADTGPPCVRVVGRFLYPREDFLDWLTEQIGRDFSDVV